MTDATDMSRVIEDAGELTIALSTAQQRAREEFQRFSRDYVAPRAPEWAIRKIGLRYGRLTPRSSSRRSLRRSSIICLVI